MSKRMKVFVSVLVAVVLLTVGGVATVMADGGSTATDNETGRNGFQARVAEILGIPQEDLIDAFEQARQEMREEAFYGKLDKAVEEGLLTQEEADEIQEWWEQKPEALDQGQLRRASCFMGQYGGQLSGNRLGVRAQRSPQPCQEMEQRAFQGMDRGWHRLGSPWLAD